MRIYLVRHGKKVSHPGNPGLTDFGFLQAEATGEFFIGKHIDRIVTSPLLRAYETARVIGEKISIEPLADHRLTERANWEGDIPLEEFKKTWMASSIDRNLQIPSGDTSLETGQRLHTVMQELLRHQPDQNVILVSHGGSIIDFLRNHMTDETLVKRFFGSFQNLLNTSIPECSITTVNATTSEPTYQVESLFRSDHLERLKQESTLVNA